MKKSSLIIAAILFSATSSLAAESYVCERIFFSDKAFTRASSDFAERIMPARLSFSLNPEIGVATISVLGSETLRLRGKKASFPIPDSRLRGHRLELNVRQLERKGEVTWGPNHSDDEFQKHSPSRYSCTAQ